MSTLTHHIYFGSLQIVRIQFEQAIQKFNLSMRLKLDSTETNGLMFKTEKKYIKFLFPR